MLRNRFSLPSPEYIYSSNGFTRRLSAVQHNRSIPTIRSVTRMYSLQEFPPPAQQGSPILQLLVHRITETIGMLRNRFSFPSSKYIYSSDRITAQLSAVPIIRSFLIPFFCFLFFLIMLPRIIPSINQPLN